MRVTICAMILLFILFGTAFADMRPVKSFEERKPPPYNGNKFGFVYGGAITENIKAKSMFTR